MNADAHLFALAKRCVYFAEALPVQVSNAEWSAFLGFIFVGEMVLSGLETFGSAATADRASAAGDQLRDLRAGDAVAW